MGKAVNHAVSYRTKLICLQRQEMSAAWHLEVKVFSSGTVDVAGKAWEISGECVLGLNICAAKKRGAISRLSGGGLSCVPWALPRAKLPEPLACRRLWKKTSSWWMAVNKLHLHRIRACHNRSRLCYPTSLLITITLPLTVYASFCVRCSFWIKDDWGKCRWFLRCQNFSRN